MVTKFKEGQTVYSPRGTTARVDKVRKDVQLPICLYLELEAIDFVSFYDEMGTWNWCQKNIKMVILTENEYNCKVRIRSIKLKQ